MISLLVPFMVRHGCLGILKEPSGDLPRRQRQPHQRQWLNEDVYQRYHRWTDDEIWRRVVMDFDVPESVVQETTQCRHAWACLKNSGCSNQPLCEVEYADGKNILFLVTKNSATCPYRLAYADRQLCLCPTHFAIHRMRRQIRATTEE